MWWPAGPNTLTNSRAVKLDPSDNKIVALMMGITHYKLTLRLAVVTWVTSTSGWREIVNSLIDSVLWAVDARSGN
jgi:hypothetical protein